MSRRHRKSPPAGRPAADKPTSDAPVPQTDLVTQTDSAAQIAGPAEADPPAPDVRVEPDADRDRDAATARPLRERRRASWTLAALAYAGFVVSAYLTIVHYRGYVSPCYVVQGCETVQTSRYSVVLGVPVALAGALFFGLLFYLAVGLLRRPTLWLVRAFKVLASLGALAMIPLFLLQAIVLKAFCSYCLVTEVLMVSIWIVSFVPTAPERSGGPLEAGAGGE